MFFLSKAARPARYALFSGFAVRALGGLDPSVLLIAADLDVFGCLEVRTPTSLHARLLFGTHARLAACDGTSFHCHAPHRQGKGNRLQRQVAHTTKPLIRHDTHRKKHAKLMCASLIRYMFSAGVDVAIMCRWALFLSSCVVTAAYAVLKFMV